MADAAGTISWYSPDPRAVLEHDDFHVSRSLRARLRQHYFEIRVDTAFAAVMRACAAPRAAEDGTWINDEFIETYSALHGMGLAHSVEAWRDDCLVGGLYGVSIGAAFMGESMFSRLPDASKVCLAALVERLKTRGYTLHDTQFLTPHLATLGARLIPRRTYLARLRAALYTHASFA